MITRPEHPLRDPSSLPRVSLLEAGCSGHTFLGKYINKIINIVNMGIKEDGINWVDALVFSSPLPTFEKIILSPPPHDTLKIPTPLVLDGASTHDRTQRGEYKNRVSEGTTGYHPLFTGPGKANRGRNGAHQGHNRADDRKGSVSSNNGLIHSILNSPPFIFLSRSTSLLNCPGKVLSHSEPGQSLFLGVGGG